LELETHVLLAHRVGLLEREHLNEMLPRVEGVGKMLNALIRSIRASNLVAPSE
jgi:four helix bundle protein